MNKYERYAVRQILLNQLYPPSENNKIMGNKALFDLLNAYFFFNIGNNKKSNTSNVEEKSNERSKDKEDDEKFKKALADYRQKEREVIFKFLATKSYNPFVIIIQSFVKFFIGLIINVARLLNIKLDN